MKKLIIMFVILTLVVPESYAYKVYWYDSNGNRVYKTIEQKDFARYKNMPRRSYVRQPRTNWEYSGKRLNLKMTTSQYTHRNCH